MLQRKQYSRLLESNNLSNIEAVISLLNQYPFDIANKRYNKDIVTSCESKDDIKEYTDLLDKLYDIYKFTPF